MDPALRRLLDAREAAAEQHTGYRPPSSSTGNPAWASSLPSYVTPKQRDPADVAMIASARRGAPSSDPGYDGPIATNRNVDEDGNAQNRTFSKKDSAPSGSGSGSGSGGSGSGGRGGGGGGSASAGFNLKAELAELDNQLEAERKRLAERFTLAESDEERERLARAMSALDRRGEESRVMLVNAYQRGTGTVDEIREDVVGRRAAQMEEVIRALEESAARVGEVQAVAEGRDAGYGVGATLGGTEGGDAEAAEIASLAQIFGGVSGNLNEVAQQDLDFVTEMLAMQEGASMGALEREVADREAAMQAAHDAQVAERIDRERAMLAELDQQLLNMFMGRRGDLEAMAMQLAAARRGGGGGGGGSRRGSSSGGSSSGLSGLSGALDLLALGEELGPDAARAVAGKFGGDPFLLDYLGGTGAGSGPAPGDGTAAAREEMKFRNALAGQAEGYLRTLGA